MVQRRRTSCSSHAFRYVSAICIATALATGPASAATSSWNYQTDSDSRPIMSGASPAGYISLTEEDGNTFVQITAKGLSNCFYGKLSATVTRTDATTIIEVPPKLTGCDHVRIVINNDGTGGQRQMKKGANWVWDGVSRGLTPRQ